MGRLLNLTYLNSGVNINAADKAVDLIEPIVKQTYNKNTLPSHGAFAGMLQFPNYKNPILVGCTDGVGSKLLLAIQSKQFTTIGIDLVAMNVNDLICCGAKPLFFLDYIAANKLKPTIIQQIIQGIVNGCLQAECALIGGEMAEMPELYSKNHFDLAGFATGVVEKHCLIHPDLVKPNNVIRAQ